MRSINAGASTSSPTRWPTGGACASCVSSMTSAACLATVVDTSLSGVRVVRELERLTLERAIPKVIVSENRTELTSVAVLRWAADRVGWHYIQPGKPEQNACIESFNSKLRDKCLNEHVFTSLAQARDHRSVALRLQLAPPALEPRSANAERVCRPGRGRSA